MTPKFILGGVTHDPINARRRLEQARATSAIAVTRRHHIYRRCHHSRHRHSSLSYFAARPILVYWLSGKMLATTKVCQG